MTCMFGLFTYMYMVYCIHVMFVYTYNVCFCEYVCIHVHHIPLPVEWHEGMEEIETECVEAANSTACGINGPV